MGRFGKRGENTESATHVRSSLQTRPSWGGSAWLELPSSAPGLVGIVSPALSSTSGFSMSYYCLETAKHLEKSGPRSSPCRSPLACHVHGALAPALPNFCSPRPHRGAAPAHATRNPRWKQCTKKYTRHGSPRRSGFLCGQGKRYSIYFFRCINRLSPRENTLPNFIIFY